MNPQSSSPASTAVLKRTGSGSHPWRWGLSVALILSVGFGVWLLAFDGRPIWSKDSKGQTEHEQANSAKQGKATTVEVVHPRQGGIDRISVQPGTVEPFESADLYAKVSGFLIETVDIGKRVEKNQVLARISVPEYEKQVKKDAATVVHTEAKVKQMRAHFEASKADEKASKQMIAQAKIEMKSKSAYHSYRSKQLDRIKALYVDKAVDAKLVDESEDHNEAAMEAENAASESIITAQFKWEAAKAKVVQAQADIDDAQAEVEVAQAELERSKVLLDYTIIKSPYDGIVTKRSFNRGAFIRSADAGNDRTPILSVDRTDLMRVVVQVPDRDVPYVDVGDRATVEISALPGAPLHGIIARSAEAEDAQTRTMRTEIDIPNPDGKLRRNMYGRVQLHLQVGSPTAVRISSAAVIKEGEQSMVRVMLDHRVRLVSVETGTDNGIEVEILHGLTVGDLVILRGNGPLEERTEVVETSATPVSKH